MRAFHKTFAAAAFALATAVTGSLPAAADELLRWVDIGNAADNAIVGVYATHVGRDDWGDNLLGYGAIQPDQWFRIDPPQPEGYCRFDVLFEFANGAEMIAWRVNLCEAVEIVTDENDYSVV